MKCTVYFYLLNEHFSVEHAEAHHGGDESELNRKYEWEDELAITSDVDSVNVHENGVYNLQGTMPSGEAFKHDVEKMRLFNLQCKDQIVVQVGCSESIIDSFELIENDERIELKVFIKDYEPMSNPVPGIYIAAQEFPKPLIF